MKKELNKKLIFNIFFLPTLIFANENYSNEYFQKALDSYNNRAFQDSYLVFKEYLKKDKLDSNFTFILARSAYEIGKFEEAEILYKNLLEETPNNSRIKLELAQTYFQQKKYEEAEVLYKEVLEDKTLPMYVKKNIKLTLDSLKKRAQKNFIKTTLSVGYGYDSNVNNNSSDDYVFLGNLPLEIEDKKSDQVAEYLLSLNHTYKLKDDLTIDNKFISYTQDYNHQSDNDLSLVIFGTGLSYYKDKLKISLAFDVNLVWLDDKTYLNNYVLTPSLQMQLNSDLIYKSNLKVIKKDFKQSDYEFRDSTYYEFKNSLVSISENFGINTLSFSLGTDNKDRSKAWNVDYNFASLKYENLYPLTPSTILSSSIEFYKDRYKIKENFLYDNKKKDNRFTFDLGVLKSINKNLSLGATFRYIDNKSNQNIYQYDKHIIRTNLYYSF
ncbi:porin family protein [Aliarcobacter skirrowii]|uniref:porin family protein n=1 Tax=Aliarcobacter skirrowii TaxID=28200 RepID=UPI0029A32184|nr:porin family protein [Aliarcobacter skirrowii]MDX4026475.1 porin family protein [Aliarcobacter skirrowii]